MSAQDAEEADDGPGRREVAHRVFAAEYDDATRSYQEGDEERAPTYVITPSGAKANRLFLVGVLTEVEQVNDQMLRARVVDPTGAFVVYAGQYQPDARATFDRAEPPAFVAVTGKARTFQPEDGDRVFSSVRPESVSTVDADTRDRWAVETARATLGRVGEMAAALRSGDHGDPTDGVALALEHYDTTPGYLAALRELATDAAGVVAGDRDEVREFTASPDDDRPADLDTLAGLLDALGDGRESTTETTSLDTDTDAGAGGAALDTDASADTGATGVGSDEEIEEIDAGGEVESFEADDDFEVSGDLGETSTGGDDDLGDVDAGDDLGGFDGDGDESADDVGEFEPGDDGDDDAGVVEGAAGDGEMYEMDDEERERIESEYGTEFSTGTEVDAPGEADIDTPAPEETGAPGEEGEADAEVSETAEEGADAETADEVGEPEEPVTDEAGDEDESVAEEPEPDEEPAEADDDVPEDSDDTEEESTGGEADEDADVDEVLMEKMRDLDDGDGADREALVEAVVDATGADAEGVSDAIQDALMSGQCYEPGEDRLKPI